MARGEKSPKHFSDQFREFVLSLLIIRDSLNEIRQGNVWHILNMSGQLRALCYAKSKKEKALLFFVADKLKLTLNVWSSQKNGAREKILAEVGGETLIHVYGFPVSVYKEEIFQEEMTLDDFLNRKNFGLMGGQYSPIEVITVFANHFGGAHYSKDIPDDLYALTQVAIDDQTPLQNFLVQLAELIYALGAKIVSGQYDFDIHLACLIPHKKLTKDFWIFEAGSQEIGSASISFNRDWKLRFSIRGINGFHFIHSKRLVPFDRPVYLKFRSWLDADLYSNLEIYCDGEVYGRSRVATPCFLPSTEVLPKFFLNRSIGDQNAGGHLFVTDLAFHFLINDIDAGRSVFETHYQELLKKSELEGWYLKEGGYVTRDAQPNKFGAVGNYSTGKVVKDGDRWDIQLKNPI